mmetsp:Transcript_14374/g.34797  ORF Transcript_14374/g.34797 Transcript_14374/m.34797 type:complete len:141 (-) Transcript_14374:1432-1854(-)
MPIDELLAVLLGGCYSRDGFIHKKMCSRYSIIFTSYTIMPYPTTKSSKYQSRWYDAAAESGVSVGVSPGVVVAVGVSPPPPPAFGVVVGVSPPPPVFGGPVGEGPVGDVGNPVTWKLQTPSPSSLKLSKTNPVTRMFPFT